MKSTLIHWYSSAVQAMTRLFQQAVQPVHFASQTEVTILAGLGLILIITAVGISRRGARTPDHELIWTERRLQGALGFGTVLLLLAFVRYEGIPYLSMSAVLWLVGLWLVGSVVQLVLYRTFVLKSARIQWHQQKAHEQYLPKPKQSAR